MDQVIINEQWRSIDGYINYQVSNIGRVRNSNTGKILKPTLNKSGYYRLILWSNNERNNYYVHRLVANEFLENSENHDNYVVDHIDQDKTNNAVYNLRYVTKSQNNMNISKGILRQYASQYKGVSKNNGKWQARVRFQGKNYHLGFYDLEEEAATAYNMKALELAG